MEDDEYMTYDVMDRSESEYEEVFVITNEKKKESGCSFN